jgi:hypothetical protein
LKYGAMIVASTLTKTKSGLQLRALPPSKAVSPRAAARPVSAGRDFLGGGGIAFTAGLFVPGIIAIVIGLPMRDADTLSEKEIERRREAALKTKLATPPKHHAPNGKVNRAQSHKGNKVQPAHQRNRRQKGR